MAEGAQGRKEVEKIRPPLFVLGNVSGGHRAHRQMKRGSHPRWFYGRQRECASGCQRICANNSSL